MIQENDKKDAPILYEIELNALTHFEPLDTLEWMIKQYDKKIFTEDLPEETKRDDMSVVPVQIPNHFKESDNKKYSGKCILNSDSLNVGSDSLSVGRSWNEVCPNPKCTLYCKPEKGNIIANGKHRMKDGTISRRFQCKICGKSFCDRAWSVFYGLRSSEDKILTAIKLLAKGMSITRCGKSLRGTAKYCKGTGSRSPQSKAKRLTPCS